MSKAKRISRRIRKQDWRFTASSPRQARLAREATWRTFAPFRKISADIALAAVALGKADGLAIEKMASAMRGTPSRIFTGAHS